MTLQEQIPLRDLSDCLLAAYEGVSRRAFRLYQVRGAGPGSDLKDWKNAERDLFAAMPVDLAESGESLYALASVPGYAAAEISVAVEDRWLLISGYGHSSEQSGVTVRGDGSGELGATSEQLDDGTPAVLEVHGCERLDSQSELDADESFRDCVVRRPFCVVDLGRKVDAARSVAVLANGLLAIRMVKVAAEENVDRVVD
ncbi:MAG: DUF2934 domain-containing protein [Candidatus Acidiferrales bacterium]